VTPQPYYADDRVALYLGDALDVLATLDAVDAVVTDPPYSSGTRKEAQRGAGRRNAMLRGERFAARPLDLDQMTTAGFVWLMRAIGFEARRLLPNGGSLLSFIDWRQWPNLAAAIETTNLRVQGMVVWDKGSFGLGNGFRSQHELVLHAAKGTPTIYDKGTGNVLRASRERPTDHPAPKPVDLVARLIRVVAPPDGIVLDPFAGAGSTLLAARAEGRRAIGVEVDEAYAEVAAKRLASAA